MCPAILLQQDRTNKVSLLQPSRTLVAFPNPFDTCAIIQYQLSLLYIIYEEGQGRFVFLYRPTPLKFRVVKGWDNIETSSTASQTFIIRPSRTELVALGPTMISRLLESRKGPGIVGRACPRRSLMAEYLFARGVSHRCHSHSFRLDVESCGRLHDSVQLSDR